MIRNFPSLAAALAVMVLPNAALTAGGEEPIGSAEYARVNAALVESHVLPRYARLSAATDEFAAAVADYCTVAGEAGLPGARARFHDAMDAWMGVEHLRFGPIELVMRGYRFHFWPQARGKVRNAVRELVAAGDEAALLPSRLAQANVAIQGLLAAEALLYGDERIGFETRTSPMACGLLGAVAGNMRGMAARTVADWRDGDLPFARVLTQPGPQNEHFQEHSEATLAFFKSLHDGLQFIADVKLKPVIGGDMQAARPVYAESRPSGRSLRNVVMNLKALQALYGGEGEPGLGGLTANSDPELDQLLRRAFRLTVATAQAIGRPLEEAATDPALRPQAEKLAIQVQALRQIVRDRLAPALALSVGFNALDGD